jgi:hypothetical protein
MVFAGIPENEWVIFNEVTMFSKSTFPLGEPAKQPRVESPR